MPIHYVQPYPTHFSIIFFIFSKRLLWFLYNWISILSVCRLRQESELLSRSSHWSQSDLQSASSANNITENNSSESTSSSETLKWLGSMSDVSVSSHATNSSNISGSGKLNVKNIFFFKSFLLSGGNLCRFFFRFTHRFYDNIQNKH